MNRPVLVSLNRLRDFPRIQCLSLLQTRGLFLGFSSPGPLCSIGDSFCSCKLSPIPMVCVLLSFVLQSLPIIRYGAVLKGVMFVSIFFRDDSFTSIEPRTIDANPPYAHTYLEYIPKRYWIPVRSTQLNSAKLAAMRPTASESRPNVNLVLMYLLSNLQTFQISLSQLQNGRNLLKQVMDRIQVRIFYSQLL